MPRSILSSLCLVLIPGALFLGLYNLQNGNHMAHNFHGTDFKVDAINFELTVAVRHVSTGGYLHSDTLFYPTGSKQQQVSIAPQPPSEATAWRFLNATAKYDMGHGGPAPHQPIVAGSTVILRHVSTSKHLHSHQEFPPPVSRGESLREVTAYGMLGFAGDANDDWIVEPTHGDVLALGSPFRLQHRLTACFLSSRGAALPEWGLGFQEVLCSRQQSGDDLWIIDAI
ncbi:MIR motif-containing protein [Mycena galopus ATCC 62051]|nr:MIR motif-containing protein [Mycena galopus ATCC 62051]